MSLTPSRQHRDCREDLTRFQHIHDPQWGGESSRQWAGWLLVAYLVSLSTLVLSVRLTGTGLPQLTDSLGLWSSETRVFGGLRLGYVEVLANIALFVPIGFLLAGFWGRRAGSATSDHLGVPDWAVWLITMALSAAVELTQMFLLTARSATVRDLACNSVGALAGVVTYRIVQGARQRARTRRTP